MVEFTASVMFVLRVVTSVILAAAVVVELAICSIVEGWRVVTFVILPTAVAVELVICSTVEGERVVIPELAAVGRELVEEKAIDWSVNVLKVVFKADCTVVVMDSVMLEMAV